VPEQREALTFTYAGSTLDFVEDWSGRRWDYSVDAAGDLVEARDPLEVANGWPGVQYAYSAGETNPDLNHNLTRITFPKDADGAPGGDRWIAFVYFNSDRVASHVDSLGNRQMFLFNVPRQESQTTDPRGFTTIYRHDLKGNLLQRVDPDGAAWTWEYDAERNVVSETDPLGRARRFEGFDARGNPARMIDRDGRATDFTYDAVSGARRPSSTSAATCDRSRSGDGLPARVGAVGDSTSRWSPTPTTRPLARCATPPSPTATARAESPVRDTITSPGIATSAASSAEATPAIPRVRSPASHRPRSSPTMRWVGRRANRSRASRAPRIPRRSRSPRSTNTTCAIARCA
jgi:YD repeat-containing protein